MTFDTEGRDADFDWAYYVTSFTMRDRTEGVPMEIQWPFLRRNAPRDTDADGDVDQAELPRYNSEGLQVRISPHNYRLLWEVGTTDWFIHDKKQQLKGTSGMQQLKNERKAKFEEKFALHPKWQEGLSEEEIAQATQDYQRLVSGEQRATVESASEPQGEAMVTDAPRARDGF